MQRTSAPGSDGPIDMLHSIIRITLMCQQGRKEKLKREGAGLRGGGANIDKNVPKEGGRGNVAPFPSVRPCVPVK